jgi:sugar phosphate isomerase/epimerase
MTQTSRRLLLQGAGAAGLAGALSGCVTGSPMPFFDPMRRPVGIQLYTLGELPRNDLDGTLGALARIGYRTVELPNYMGKTPEQIRAAVDKAGLKATSMHVGMRPGTDAEPGLLGDLGQVARHARIIGASYVVAPIFNPPDDVKLDPIPGEGGRIITRIARAMGEERWKRLAGTLNTIGKTLKAEGLRLGYHNHNMEFQPVGSRLAWDILLAETDPDLVTFELDVGWVAASGQDPAATFARNPGRYRLIHVKDLKATSQANFDLRMDPTEVGSGRIEWAKVLPAARAAGVEQFFVEQEAPFERDRMAAAEISFGYLSQLQA